MKKYIITLLTALVLIPFGLCAQNRSYTISNISHKISQSDGAPGIEFKMNVKAFDNRGRRMQVFGFIQYQNENGEWKYVSADPEKSFVNSRGQVYAQSHFVRCFRKKAGRHQIKVFVPSELLPSDPQVKYYRVRFRVCDRFNNNFEYRDASEIPYYYFEFNNSAR